MATLYGTIEQMCRYNEIDVTTMCRESGASRGSMTDLKKGRISSLSAETLDRIARYFHVTIDFLLDPDDDKYQYLGRGPEVYDDYIRRLHGIETEKPATSGDGLVNGDPELTEMLQRLKDDPHMRMLFSLTKNAKPEDIEKAIKIIQTLKGE